MSQENYRASRLFPIFPSPVFLRSKVAERCQHIDYGHSGPKKNERDPANSVTEQTGAESSPRGEESDDGKDEYEPLLQGMIVITADGL